MIHLYTGDGKGKTTAAVGLAARHAGTGGGVAFVQFLKSAPTGEVAALERIPNITVLRNRTKHGFFKDMSEDIKRLVTTEHNENLAKARAMAASKAVSMIVLDEICAACALGLVDRAAVEDLLADPCGAELVMTGREPGEALVNAADYITEMRCLRHPYEKGVPARRGVEF